jgi:PAS domain S-box-containing protein
VQELPDFYHVLSPSGFFLFASESIKDLAGYSPEELVGRSITEMLHPDDVDPFVKAFNQCIATKAPLSIYARFRKSDARHLVIEFTGHARYGDALPDSSTLSALTGISTTSPSIAKCFFAMGRLYPAKNTALLDSYLEHKIENERLKSQAKELYDELGEDVLSSAWHGNSYASSLTMRAGSYYSQGIDAASFARTAAAADPNMDYTLYSSLNSSSRAAAGFHPSSRPSPTKLAPGDDKKKHKSRRGNGEQDFVCHECGTADSPGASARSLRARLTRTGRVAQGAERAKDAVQRVRAALRQKDQGPQGGRQAVTCCPAGRLVRSWTLSPLAYFPSWSGSVFALFVG